MNNQILFFPSFPTSSLGMHTNVDRANEDIHSQAGAWERDSKLK